MKKYIFGYGSLINLISLSKTMNREVRQSEIIPVKLLDYKRIWNLKETLYSSKLDKNINGIFLNIEESKNEWTNGVIFEVSELEFYALTQRERNYSCIDISKKVVPYKNKLNENYNIFVFVADNKIYLQNEQNENTFVMTNYIQIVEKGCSDIGDYFLDDYNRTTQKNNFKLLEGQYSFV
jgi:cation transport regulator ChaC